MPSATLVQSAFNNATSTSVVQTLGFGGTNPTSIAVTAGNTIIVYAWCTIASRTLTVADNVNAGNYNQDKFNNTRCSCGIYSFNNVGAGSTTITMTQSGASAAINLIAEEWAGILVPTPLDKSVSIDTAANTTATTGATATLSQAAELAVAQCGLTAGGSAINVTAPFTISPHIGAGNASANLQPNSTSPLTVTFTWTGSVTNQLHLVTYKISGAAPPPAVTPQQLLLGVGS